MDPDEIDDMESHTTEMVVKTLSEEDAKRYRALMAKPPKELSETERRFLLAKETSALTKGLAENSFRKGEVAGCNCNAGLSEHRRGCPLYGEPSGASAFLRALGL